MTKRRRTLAVAAATTLLAGLGAYGATTAFASSSHPSPGSAATATVSPAADGKNADAMIRRCASHLPAKDRGAVEKQMREMMSGHHGTSTNGMMGSASPGSSSGMMRGTP